MKTLKLLALVAVNGKLPEKKRLWSLSYTITGGATLYLFSQADSSKNMAGLSPSP